MSTRARVAVEITLVCLVGAAAGAGVLAWMGLAPWLLLAVEVLVCAYLLTWSLGHLDDLRPPEGGPPLDRLGLPNLVSAARLVFVPPVGIALLTLPSPAPPAHRAAVLGLLAAVVLSDSLDGLLARNWGPRTRFGAFLDPTADFFLHLVLPPVLLARGLVPAWFVAVVLARIALLTAGGTLLMRRGLVDRGQLAAMKLGKPAVVSTGAALVGALLAWVTQAGQALVPWLCLLATALTAAAVGEKAWFFTRAMSRHGARDRVEP